MRLYRDSPRIGVFGNREQLVAAIVEAIPGASVTIEALPPGSPETEPIPPLDLERSRRELGYEPAFDMVRAIGDYADWVRSLGAS